MCLIKLKMINLPRNRPSVLSSSLSSSQALIKKVVPTIFRRHLQVHLGSTLHLSLHFYCFLFCLVYFCLVCFCFVFFCLVCFCFVVVFINSKTHKNLQNQKNYKNCAMVSFFETRSYWQGGSTDDEQKHYKGYRLSQKGIYLWKLIK